MTIYEAIGKIITDIGPIAKGKRNANQGFMYRGIDDVMNSLQPLFAKYGVFVTPEVLDLKREERVSAKGGALFYSIMTVRYTFHSSDGTLVQATVIGEGMDSGDKASNKAMAVAMKYACFQVFCIATESDPDAESHEVVGKTDTKPAQWENTVKSGEDVEIKMIREAKDLDTLKQLYTAAYNLADDSRKAVLVAAKDKRKAELTAGVDAAFGTPEVTA